MVKFEIEVNSRVEIILEDGICKSVIQEWDENNLYIAVPMIKGQYIKFAKGQKLTMYNYLHSDKLFKFECKVLGLDKCGNMPLYKLTLPEEVRKIQRREFVRVETNKRIKYSKLEEEKFNSAVLIDLSGGGMRIKANEKLELNELVTIYLEDEKISVEGKIVRADKYKDYYDYGISYSHIDNKTREKLIKIIFTIMRKQRELT